MAVDAETHYSAEILGRPADSEAEFLHLYAGILGQSMDLWANRLSLMVGVTPEGLTHAMHVLEDPAPVMGQRSRADLHAFAHHCAHLGQSLRLRSRCDEPRYARLLLVHKPRPETTRERHRDLCPFSRLAAYFCRPIDHDFSASTGPANDGVLGQQLSKIARVYTAPHGFSA